MRLTISLLCLPALMAAPAWAQDNKQAVVTPSLQASALLPSITSSPSGVTTDDWDRLVKQIEALRQEVKEARAVAAVARQKADNSYGVGNDRRFRINGYVQTRFQSARSGNRTMFPQGMGAVTSATGSFNGNYAVGGTNETFFVRRARLFARGDLNANASYVIQLDATGWTTNNTSPNNVTVREAAACYTFGDGNPDNNVRLAAGIIPVIFGYEFTLFGSDHLSPEHPLAFNDGGNGLFINQCYDRGASVSYNLTHPGNAGLRFAVGIYDGTGLSGATGGGVTNGSLVGSGNDNNSYLDQVYRLAYHTQDNVLGGGISYYNGRMPRTGIVPDSSPAAGYIGANYQEGKKQLFGLDAHLNTPSGLLLRAEYVGGTYEFRSFFTGASSFKANQYAPGNKAEGYLLQGGWTFSPKTRPTTIALSYDVFRRSKGGVSGTAMDGGGASGSSFDDINLGYGVLHCLDKQTRLRVWYEKPNRVAHAANVAAPPRIGLFTTEIQVRF